MSLGAEVADLFVGLAAAVAKAEDARRAREAAEGATVHDAVAVDVQRIRDLATEAHARLSQWLPLVESAPAQPREAPAPPSETPAGGGAAAAPFSEGGAGPRR